MEVLPLRDEAAWEAYVSSHPAATTYHQLAWRTIFAESFGYRPHYLVALEQGRVRGCLPLFRVASPLSRRLVSVPFRDRGGPLWDTPEAFQALVGKARFLTRQIGAAFLELKSERDYPRTLLEQSRLTERHYWIHSSTSLEGLDPDALLKRIGPKTRNMLRQAERAGLRCERSDRVEVWYPIYLRSQRNLGLPPLPLRFFRAILRELGPQATIIRVLRGSEPLSATIVLVHRGTGMYAYSASVPQGRGARPNDFMLFQAFLWLLGQGAKEFDLGSDAPAQESLLFFKRKWLAQQRVIPTYTWGKVDDSVADSSHPRYRAVRWVFRHLPLPCLDLIGRLTARFFG